MKMFIPEKYWDFKDVFLRTNFDSLPPHSKYDHAINLKDSFKPQRGKIYPLSPREQVELDKFLEEHLATGQIRRLNSPQATPFFFTPKVEEVNAPGIDPGLRPEEVIIHSREALALFRSSYPSRSLAFNYFTHAILYRFEQTGQSKDLGQATTIVRHLLCL
jgi:hypothetical protein